MNEAPTSGRGDQPPKGIRPDPSPPTSGKHDHPQTEEREENPGGHPYQYWIDRGRDAHQASVDWFEMAQQQQLQDNLDLFASRHPSDSRYHTSEYNNRNRLFRPKTRTAARQFEASVAIAHFANQDTIEVKAKRAGDKDAAQRAEIKQQAFENRLKDLNWFQLVVGGHQDAYKQGVVISCQEWAYEDFQIPDKEDFIVLEDKPRARLVPMENFRFDAAASWDDPVGTSSFLIEDISSTVQLVKERMVPPGETPERGSRKWFYYDEAQILQALSDHVINEAIRQAREGNTLDPKSAQSGKTIVDHQIVWVRRIIMRVDGFDWVWYMLGDHLILSEPVPLQIVAPHLRLGERGYAMGVISMETHTTYPAAPVELAEGEQSAANILRNQRLDNIELVLNKRYKLVRDTNVDLVGLQASMPGGYYWVDSPDDVEAEEFADVTRSAYMEQDRINADFDAITGNMDQGSISTNRSLNETVGGMRILQAGSNELKSYMTMTVSITWLQKVVDQIMRMIEFYEDDQKIIEAAQQVLGEDVPPEFDVEAVKKEPVECDINVGLAMDPLTKVNNLFMALSNLSTYEQFAARLDIESAAKEVFSLIGYRAGTKQFFIDTEDEDPAVAQLRQELEQAQQFIEQKGWEQEGKLQIEQLKGDIKLRDRQMQNEAMLTKAEMDARLKMLETQLVEAKTAQEWERVKNERDALIHQMRQAEFEMAREMAIPERTEESNQPGRAGTMARDDYGLLPGSVG